MSFPEMNIFYQKHVKAAASEDTAGDELFMISPLSVTLKGKPANESRHYSFLDKQILTEDIYI